MADSLTIFGDDFTGVTGIKATGTGNGTLTYIRPQGTKSISANGSGIDVTEYASVDVAVPAPSPSLQAKTKSYTPSETAQSETVSADGGYDGLSSVAVSVGAISSTYVGSGVARKSGSDLTASGATVTAPAGYYESNATKSVASGTEGTPTASKGTVSNHAISVTPSVTNTAGYISGGTKTGTAVSVSASELVSGSETKTSNGTYDVTNLAEIVVNVSGGGSVSYDTKTVTASNYPTSLSFTSMKGQPKFFAVRLNTSVSSSGSTTYYYIVDIASNGTTTHGNCFRIGSTRQVTNLTSGYSWTYSGTTLTVSSSAASRSASPGAFYSGSYELMYAY